MTSTLITLAAGALVAFAVGAIFELNRQRSRRRDREIVRRFHRYMARIPPYTPRPW